MQRALPPDASAESFDAAVAAFRGRSATSSASSARKRWPRTTPSSHPGRETHVPSMVLRAVKAELGRLGYDRLYIDADLSGTTCGPVPGWRKPWPHCVRVMCWWWRNWIG